MAAPRRQWPLAPLLKTYRDLGTRPAGPRLTAVRAARTDWLNDHFLDTAGDDEFREALLAFYDAVVPLPLHRESVKRRARLVRHGLTHWARGADAPAAKWGRCVDPGGPYFVAGLGRPFWAAVVKSLNPAGLPDWTAEVEAGLTRLGLAGKPASLGRAVDAYGRLMTAHPDMNADRLDHFLALVAAMRGRSMPAEPPAGPDFAALAAGASSVDGAAARRGFLALGDAAAGLPPGELFDGLFAEAEAAIGHRFHLNADQATRALQGLADDAAPSEPAKFGGFCPDTFAFLRELAGHNRRAWMEQHRERYRFALREPAVELCRELAERYVRPVLCQQHGWGLECEARTGKALTSITKNDYGRSVPYRPELWLTFYRAGGGRRGQAQLFVRVGPDGVEYGVRVGRHARDVARHLRDNVREHAAALFETLRANNALNLCRFHNGDFVTIDSAEALTNWTVGSELSVSQTRDAGDPLLTSDELVGDVMLALDRLVPVFACAADDDPSRHLRRPAHAAGGGYGEADFLRDTFLTSSWLKQARALLTAKRQLILQGVPGTGKTHVARSLARAVTGGRGGSTRLVQFHPAYGYEEFVEGVRCRADADGRVSYPVEDGVLAEFAAAAAASPGEPFVLVIDEINRGNLPRVFGELLYLLEYREQGVTLPASRRAFRLPANLYLIGTMNPADRSVAGVDQALRRRFCFLDMPPDARVLADWLAAHPPAAGDGFGQRVVTLLETLNRRLRADYGEDCQVGHSFFMVPGLDDAALESVWEHQVRPALDEFARRHPGRGRRYSLRDLLAGRPRAPAANPSQT